MSTSKTTESQPAVLDPAADYLVIIGSYTVAPERADELLEFLTKSAQETIRFVPGFISASFHVSLDQTQIVNYGQWKNAETLLAAKDNPKVVELLRRQSEIATTFTSVMQKLKSSVIAASQSA